MKKPNEIPKVYDPKNVEDKWYAYWMKHDLFRATVNKDKKPYSILIPPPNVTGALHIGHAYNNTVQDIYTRFKRMQGFEALWTPGTDHAGITTQTVVERQLASEGKDRKTIGREAFIDEVWAHKQIYRDRIINQLMKMGCSCDWEREWFTMDDHLSDCVKRVFVHFYSKGWIYKGDYIVNWCPYSQSAISDEEVTYKSVNGKLWHFKYPVKDSDEFLVVATTRPETMLGDTGVAVHPEDKRYAHLVGNKVVLPIVGREIPIFADAYVDMEFGSGAVKVTPAHDPNDFEMGKRHNLDFVNIMNGDATLNDNVPEPFRALERFAARKKVVAEMKRLKYLDEIEDYTNRVGYSQRGNVPIEPLVSTQWFLKMDELAKPALEAVRDGRIQIHPEKWIKTYENWMTNIHDWCISRQLWWGHRIPAYYNKNGEVFVAMSEEEAETMAGEKGLRQDSDVLDTWFSSWLLPFTTMGWPEKTPEMSYFFPTNLLVTGPDIIFFWVARMIMSTLEFTGQVPFHVVYFNGIVRDEQGRKMSKSLGNGIDPIDMIDKYSADALRFTLIDMTSEGQDINLGEKHFETGRNFSNKVWNAFRFLGMNQKQIPAARPRLPEAGKITDLTDRWILSRYHRAVEGITSGLENYKLHDAMNAVYHFFWSDFCDWYLEMIKERLYGDDEEAKVQTLSLALYVMDGIVRLMHPIVPYITEEIWQSLDERQDGESVMTASWETPDEKWIDPDVDAKVEVLRNVIMGIRNIRGEMKIVPSKKGDLVINAADTAKIELLRENQHYIRSLGRIGDITFSAPRPKTAGTSVVDGIEVFLQLEGLINIDDERNRIQKEIDRLERQILGIDKKLMNQHFVEKAPGEVITREKSKRENYSQTLDKLKTNLDILST